MSDLDIIHPFISRPTSHDKIIKYIEKEDTQPLIFGYYLSAKTTKEQNKAEFT